MLPESAKPVAVVAVVPIVQLTPEPESGFERKWKRIIGNVTHFIFSFSTVCYLFAYPCFYCGSWLDNDLLRLVAAAMLFPYGVFFSLAIFLCVFLLSLENIYVRIMRRLPDYETFPEPSIEEVNWYCDHVETDSNKANRRMRREPPWFDYVEAFILSSMVWSLIPAYPGIFIAGYGMVTDNYFLSYTGLLLITPIAVNAFAVWAGATGLALHELGLSLRYFLRLNRLHKEVR